MKINEKPNVLLIMADQMRFDAMRCMGNTSIESPNLDYLASIGTLFTSAYTTCPSCIPARASLMTGLSPYNTGIMGMGKGQKVLGPGYAHTLPGEFSKAGWHTIGVGKMHFSPQRCRLGFDQTILDESLRVESPDFESDYLKYYRKYSPGEPIAGNNHGISYNSWMGRPWLMDEHLHPTHWTAAESIRAIKERDPSCPLFLKVSFARPHSPYDPPQWFYEKYKEKKLKPPYKGDWADIHDVPALDYDSWHGTRPDNEIHTARALYYGSVSFIDNQIGRIMQYLRRNGLWNNTIIIFTSDHGDMLGDHNLWRKTYAYEGSAHIPFIIRLPDSYGKQVSRCDFPVCLEDIMPTLLDACGLSVPDTDGRSLMGLILGSDGADWRKFLHGMHKASYVSWNEMHYVTDGKRKFVWFPKLDGGIAEQFFDLTLDPGEEHDLMRAEKHTYRGVDYTDEITTWRGYLKDTLKQYKGEL